jgi:5-formyltetrahydrofolate cyclo-ligase
MNKIKLRKKCIKKLKKVSKSNSKFSKDKKISQKLETIINSKKIKSILFYLPLGIEADLRKLMLFYKKRLKIFVPFIEGESFKMVEYRLPLKKNGFGILEPASSRFMQKEVDLIVVPVVGVDRNLQRIGFGKGMYDRFYEKLKSKPIVIFVQRVKCFTKKRITDAYDISADFYITP